MNTTTGELTDRTAEPFQRSAEVERLVKVFVALAEGEQVSYSTVSAIIMEKAQSNHGRSITLSARKIACKDFRVVIACESNQGFVRVRNSDIADLMAGHRQKIRSRTVKAGRELAAVDPKKLSNGQVSKYFTELSWVGVLKHFTSPSVNKQLGEAVKNEQLAVGDVLRICGSK